MIQLGLFSTAIFGIIAFVLCSGTSASTGTCEAEYLCIRDVSSNALNYLTFKHSMCMWISLYSCNPMLFYRRHLLSHYNQLVSCRIADPIAQTEYGQIRGSLRYAVGAKRPVYSYFGVKYGRSPDYVFRFQPPENPWHWDGIRNATDESRPMCVQVRVEYTLKLEC